jgi:hypothetical protein
MSKLIFLEDMAIPADSITKVGGVYCLCGQWCCNVFYNDEIITHKFNKTFVNTEEKAIDRMKDLVNRINEFR